MADRLTASGYRAARPTRIEGLGYRCDGPSLWRICDLSDDRHAPIGPLYRSKIELLADLERYAAEGGWR